MSYLLNLKKAFIIFSIEVIILAVVLAVVLAFVGCEDMNSSENKAIKANEEIGDEVAQDHEKEKVKQEVIDKYTNNRKDVETAKFVEDAYEKLSKIIRRIDDDPKPPDFIEGSAASLIHNMILDLMEALDCS